MIAERYSVVIPTFNRRDALVTVLRGLERQSAPELLAEVVVVDDGSSDGTARAVRELETPLNLRLLEGRRGGPAAARNAGVEVAAAERILLLCDDIEPAETLLERHHARSRDASGPHAVVGRVAWPPGRRVSAFEDFVMENYHFGFSHLEGREELPFHAFITANLSIRRSLLIDLGGFDEGFSYGWEDTDLGLRATRAGVTLLYAPDAVGYHHHAIDPVSYCARQRAVGRSAVHFVRKHPERAEVVGFDRRPKPWTLRRLAKAMLFNPAMRRVWWPLAGALSSLGATRGAELLWSQLLAQCYYAGMSEALAQQSEATGTDGAHHGVVRD